MRTLNILALSLLPACATNDQNTIGKTDLVGVWSGSSSNNIARRYEFGADGSFKYGPLRSGSFTALAQGTFSVTGHTITLDATITDDAGDTGRRRLELDAYATATKFCDGAYYPQGNPTGVVGTWTTMSTTQTLDSTGAPTTPPEAVADSYDLASNGNVLETTADGSQQGTYTQTGDKVTITIPHGSLSTSRTLTLVDEQVMCDPVYSH
jgi:hypothetical protein